MKRTIGLAVMLALTSGCSSQSHQVADGGAIDAGDAAVDIELPADATQPPADASADAVDPRAELRQRSIFDNLDFEQADDSGGPASWKCSYFGQAPTPEPLCELKQGDSISGSRHLVIAPQTAVFQDAEDFDETGHLRFDLFARREGGASAADAYVFGYDVPEDVLWQLIGKGLDPAIDDWSLLWSDSADVSGTERLRLVIFNSSDTAPLEVDDGIAVIDPEPIVIPGHLLHAEHATSLACQVGTETETIWIPLPLDHGAQVPLHIGLDISPPSAADQIDVSYAVDAVGNLGALLDVPPEASFFDATIRWEGVVLTREATEGELADLYAATAGVAVDSWLAVTAVVPWDHPALQSTVEQVVVGLTDPLDKMSAILGWTSTYVTNPGQLQALDAVSVYETKNASCTGFANLAAAAGRVAAVPTRSVANYLVGMAQQTHSINQFYLGADRGWRMVEPQATATTLPADYAVVVHINTAEDEGEGAMDTTTTQAWAIAGVPLRSLVTPLGATGRCYPLGNLSHQWPDCWGDDKSACDNRASYQAGLRVSPAEVQAAFDQARALWQTTLARFSSAVGPDPAEQAVRATFLQSRDLGHLNATLAQVQAQQQN